MTNTYLGIALLCCAGTALAEDSTLPPLWEIGAFGLGASQQSYPGAPDRVNRALLVPTFIYRGNYLRADGEGAGIRAFKSAQFEFDVGAAAAFGSKSAPDGIRSGMPQLGAMVEFGPRLKWHLAQSEQGRLRAEFPLRGVFDLNDRLHQKGVVFEPELVWERRRREGWSYNLSASALFGDQKLNDTFFGVASLYARPGRPAYQAGSGLVALRLGGGVSHALGRDWRLFIFTRLDDVHASANRDSPLVQKKLGASAGFGLSYTFIRSDRRAAD